MATPLSRLKTIACNKDVHSYEDLYNYVHQYCGNTLMDAVVVHEFYLRRFFDAQTIAREAAGMQKSKERTLPRCRGLAGCSMLIERPVDKLD